MRILLLTHSFNSLSQRLFGLLRAQGHEVSVELDIADSVTEEAVALFRPDVVLAPLSLPLQAFLLKTSILGRLTPSLCNAVTGRDDAQQMLEEIERHNLFIFALDTQGQWFRYHTLFVETLNERRLQMGIDEAQLHERASNWLAGHQYWTEAIRHALAAGDSSQPAA